MQLPELRQALEPRHCAQAVAAEVQRHQRLGEGQRVGGFLFLLLVGGSVGGFGCWVVLVVGWCWGWFWFLGGFWGWWVVLTFVGGGFG